MSLWRSGGLLATLIGYELTKAAIHKISTKARRRQREKTTKTLECQMNNAHQELKNKMEALREDFKKLQKSSQSEVQLFRADPEQEQGKEEEEIARALEIRLKKNLQQLSQKIQTLEDDVQEWPETIKDELQRLRADLERNHGTKEEEIARALEFRLKKNLRQLFRRIKTLEDDVQEWPETTKHELQLLRAELENKLGISAQKAERIFLTRALELAKGKKIIIWTDSNYAFGAVDDHSDTWRKRRLLAAQDFSRSTSGREVEWTIPGASDDPHGNQDQRTTCLDSLFMREEGTQRNMDIRASRTIDIQVLLMVTLGVLISFIILTRLFTFHWP